MIQYDFSEKIVLITASTQGIGFGIAQAFYNAGAKVIICSRNKINVDNALKKLSIIDSDRIFAANGDISKLNFIEDLVNESEEYFGDSIDILINNSGGPPPMDAISISDQDWFDAINSNFLSVARLSSLSIPKMIKKKYGRIINLTSTLAKEPKKNMVLSNVTRAAVSAYSKTLSKEVGQHGITVNTILTGGCLTERFYSLINAQIKETGETAEEAINRLAKNVPVGFFSKPSDFSNLILFLASEEASYITGTSVPLDGGASENIF